MTFILGKESKAKLKDVHSDLAKIVEAAIKITKVDFCVEEGLRSVERQKKLVAAKASRTMNSRHLTGHAVDLVAMVGIQKRWDWPLYYDIARAMQTTANDLKIKLRWGGVWDKLLNEYKDPELEVFHYVTREKLRMKKSVYIDGPHFELNWADYPK